MEPESLPVIIPDASLILKWVLDPKDEPHHEEAARLLDLWKQGKVEFVVPTLWVYEVGNILALKRPLDAKDLLVGLIDLGLPEVRLDGPLAARAIELALTFRSTCYDTSYLALAEARSGILVTAYDRFVRRLPADAPAMSLSQGAGSVI